MYGVAVIDVAYSQAVVTKFCVMTETVSCIVLNALRESAPVLPARRDSIKPTIKKVTGRQEACHA